MRSNSNALRYPFFSCSKCDNGYYVNHEQTGCIQCISNFNIDIDLECIKCPLGTFSFFGESSCDTNCPPGTYSKKNNIGCYTCSEGYYTNTEGSIECNKCPEGELSYLNRTGCYKCKKGYYSPKGTEICIKCDDGKYSDITYATECKKCPSGTYSSNDRINCIQCLEGSYSNEGSGSCTQCEKGTFINIKGATNCIKCDIGYYSDNLGSTFCKKCPEGMNSSLDFTYCISVGESNIIDKKEIEIKEQDEILENIEQNLVSENFNNIKP